MCAVHRGRLPLWFVLLLELLMVVRLLFRVWLHRHSMLRGEAGIIGHGVDDDDDGLDS